MGLYQAYSTDKELEERGVILDFGDHRVRIARAGGANLKFARVFEALTKPVRRAIHNESLSETKAKEIAHKAYAEAVVLGWDTPVEEDGKVVYKPFIYGPDGEEIPYSKENVVKVFTDLPDFYVAIKTEAERISNFRREAQADESKNS